MNKEIFSLPNRLTFDTADEQEKFVGYAIKWDQPSVNMGGFVRVFKRGCFTESLAATPVNYLYAHDDNDIMASTRNGTLTLREDDTGLWCEVTPPAWDAKFCGRIRDGLVDGQSVGVYDAEDNWEEASDDKPLTRNITKATLCEISATSMPAFTCTSLESKIMSDRNKPAEKQPLKINIDFTSNIDALTEKALMVLKQRYAEYQFGIAAQQK